MTFYAKMPLIMPNFTALGKMMYEKSIAKKFLRPSVFWRPKQNFLGQIWLTILAPM